MRKATR
jgi:hypothetical protein